MTKILFTLKFALRGLALHKLRSSLTILGIIFGVASVITMLAVGEGASKAAQDNIRKLGSTNIIISSVKKIDEEANEGSRVSRYGVTNDDISRIKIAMPDYVAISRQRIYKGDVSYRSNEVDTEVIACESSIFKVKDIEIKKGRALCDLDQRYKNNVCVIAGPLARKIFPYQDPLKHKINFKGSYFQVVGITKPESSTDSSVYIPYASAISNYGTVINNRSNGSYIYENVDAHKLIIKLANTEAVYEGYEKIKRIMAHGHNVLDYEIQVPIKLLEQAAETKRMFSILLGSIAGISLLVGGIGIMNIMLATVSERTKEIGLRRAIGAKRKDIIIQFMAEAIVLSLIGGLIGVLLGIIVPFWISYFTGIDTQLSISAIVLAFLISGLTGIIFGSYPAIKSASLSPIEALKDI